MNSIEKIKKDSTVRVVDDCLSGGSTKFIVKRLTVTTGNAKHVDIRAFVSQQQAHSSETVANLEVGSRITFDSSLVSLYSANLVQNTFVVEKMYFCLDEEDIGGSYVVIRCSITLYDKGRRIRISQNREVECDGATIGTLVLSGRDDENESRWELSIPDHSHFPITNYEISKISKKKTIQEIGEYLDDWLQNWNMYEQ